MGRFSTWLRKRAGLLLACFLAVFALTPAFDSVVCEVDEAPAAHALVDHALQAGHEHSGHTDSSGVCVHGHCHQATSPAPDPVQVAAHLKAEGERYGLALASVPVSDRHFRLIRPPRV